ncbi:TIGR02281 family clan AA aspartic protease [Paracoccus sp. (in: a-proteobacteria)]|uniref:retropepsin-like aspartic protease family protein n=1 Tax=Paracoccus sp. TaxID=267 RepID=UPI00289CE2A2|nr:TIGR02281 family clan AA aspartic protease [Paracoccus sp. (in: a-proteobacteria)]
MINDLPRLAYLVLLLVAVGGFLVVEFRSKPGQTMRQALAWGLIFAGTIAVAGLWSEISQTVSPRQQVFEGGRIEIPVSPDGHYYLSAQLNGKTVDFVVDTGATTIALSRDEAQKIGIDTANLAFISQARTANGIVATAPVVIRSFEIGDIHDENVMAMVIDGDLGQSLLGMSYLARFARVSIESDRLVLER